ncbi:putative flavonol 3-O-glucosyltransferase [Rosa chinensis]|uniref:Putative flavonol 3-O-glucosyltransferase n=1 Tax=Rosa chinensis TaxID=74649 RepID=A0A2P6QQU9_ROSCH|nr:putative flavonol 3-O-glucosyltransferase [Rosa chinensis]
MFIQGFLFIYSRQLIKQTYPKVSLKISIFFFKFPLFCFIFYRNRYILEISVFGTIDISSKLDILVLGQKLPQATAVADNSFETMDLKVSEELKKRLKKLLLVGPLHLLRYSVPSAQSDDDEEEKDVCLPWLDNHKHASVAYISFGSVGALPPMEVAALAEALEEGGFPFLWSFRGNLEDFPKDLSKEHHWKSCSLGEPSANPKSSVYRGVCYTWRLEISFGECNLCVAIVWKIGMRIEGGVFTKSGAIKVLEQALSLEQGKEMRQRVGVLKQLAQETVGPNGSSAQDLKALVEIIKS